MNTATIIEAFGYLGSALVVISMLMSSIFRLRVINLIGSIISGTYALIVGALPLGIMNICLIVINLYNLFKLKKNSKSYDIVPSDSKDSLIRYFLHKYNGDISKFFPAFSVDGLSDNTSAYAICYNSNIAGVILGTECEGVLDVLIDYTTPDYRDCAVGAHLYSQLPSYNIQKLTYSGQLSNEHLDYLKNMGFVESNGIYEKIIAR